MLTDDGVTISMPPCEVHPPLREWPVRDLIQASCPRCFHAVDGLKTERELKARRVEHEIRLGWVED